MFSALTWPQRACLAARCRHWNDNNQVNTLGPITGNTLDLESMFYPCFRSFVCGAVYITLLKSRFRMFHVFQVLLVLLVLLFFTNTRTYGNAGTAHPASTISHSGVPSGNVISFSLSESAEATQDLGFIELGSRHTITFEVQNPYERAILIRKIRSECSCLSVVDAPTEIKPRSFARFRIEYHAFKESGTYSKKVWILTDDPKHPELFLRVVSHTGLPLEARPAEQDLGTLVSGECRITEVKIRNHGKNPVKLIYSTATRSGCLAIIPRVEILPGGEVLIPIFVRSGLPTQKVEKATVYIHTNCPTQVRIDVHLRYRVSSEYHLSKEMIGLGMLRPGEERTCEVEISASRKQLAGFLKDCKAVGLKNVKCDVAYSHSGRTLQKALIRCRLTGGKEVGRIEGKLRLELEKFNRPVEIPITGVVATEIKARPRESGGI